MSVLRFSRWAGIVLAVATISVLSYITFTNAFVAIVKNSPFWGIIMSVAFLICLTLTYINLAIASYVDPGPLPPWLAKNRVESFVKDVLANVIENENRHAKNGKSNKEAAPPQPPQPVLLPGHSTINENNNTTNTNNIDGTATNTNITKDAYLLNDKDKYISANAALSAALAERLTTNTTTATSSGVLDESSYATTNTSPSLSNAGGHNNNFYHTGNHNAVSNTHASSTADTFLSGNASHTMMPNMNNAHDSLYAVDNSNNINNNNNYVNVNLDMEDDRRLPMHFPARMQERRRRKEQLGLEILSVGQLANNALVALNGDRTSVEREMEFLLRGTHLCRFCDVYKLQETHHCNTCERCVFEMDHHCEYFGQCVGVANQKFYLLFLIYTTLSCVLGGLACVIAVSAHWAFFYTARDSNSSFFLSFAFVAAFSIMLIPFTTQAFLTLGRGETTVMQLNREDREIAEQYVRRFTLSGIYRPLFAEDALPAPRRFVWGNLRHAFGDGSFLEWLLPIPARRASEETQEARFWSSIQVLIQHQLHAAADVANGTHHSASVEIATPTNTITPAQGNENNEHDDGLNTDIAAVKEGKAPIAVAPSLADTLINNKWNDRNNQKILNANTDASYKELDIYNEPANVLSLPQSYKEANINGDGTSYNVIPGARTLDPAGPLNRITPGTSPTKPERENTQQ